MRPGRAAVVVAVLVLAVVGVAYLARNPPGQGAIFIPCVFHKVTGLHCPGCGMTRAAHELTQFQPLQAFWRNPLGVILLPFVLVGVGLEVAAWLYGSRYRGPRVRLPMGAAWTLVVVVMSYWVLRNVPAWPFELLAPS